MGKTIRSLSVAGGRDGFILPATLFVMAAVIVAAGVYSSWVSHMVSLAGEQKDFARLEIDRNATLSVLLYHMSLGERTKSGVLLSLPLPEGSDSLQAAQTSSYLTLRLDDHCYKGIGDVRFSIQDKNGLFGVNQYNRAQFGRFLGVYGVPVERYGQLLDTLSDYTDNDDFLHLNGAEKNEYLHEGYPPPPNRMLITPQELGNVLGWERESKLWQSETFRRNITIATAGIPNFNTAPLEVLQSVYGINRTIAAAIIEKRGGGGYTDLADMEQKIGYNIEVDQLGVVFFPGYSMRLTFWHSQLSSMREVNIRFTPYADGLGPWQIESVINLARGEMQVNAKCENIEELFEAYTLPSE